MYYGKMTKELENLVEQYEQLFGYDPCGEEKFEIGDNSYKDFVDVLKKCVKNKKDIFYFWGTEDEFIEECMKKYKRIQKKHGHNMVE